MPTYQERVRAIPGTVRALILVPFLLAGLGVGVYGVWTYSGLYRWMVEGQGALMGEYVQPWTEVLAVALPVLLGLLPAGLILFALARLGVFPVPPDAGSGLPPGPTPAAAAADQWIRAHKFRLLGVLLGLMGMAGGGVIWLHGRSAGPLTDLRAADLEAGRAPASGWVRPLGLPLWDQRLDFDANDSYAPVVSERWKPGDKVALFVRVASAPPPPPGPLKGDGMLVVGGLPGPVRTGFEQSRLPPAEHHQVVYLDRTPENEMAIGVPLFGAGLILLLLTSGVWAMLAVRDRLRRVAAP
jgi:hypothetical protein